MIDDRPADSSTGNGLAVPVGNLYPCNLNAIGFRQIRASFTRLRLSPVCRRWRGNCSLFSFYTPPLAKQPKLLAGKKAVFLLLHASAFLRFAAVGGEIACFSLFTRLRLSPVCRRWQGKCSFFSFFTPPLAKQSKLPAGKKAVFLLLHASTFLQFAAAGGEIACFSLFTRLRSQNSQNCWRVKKLFACFYTPPLAKQPKLLACKKAACLLLHASAHISPGPGIQMTSTHRKTGGTAGR